MRLNSEHPITTRNNKNQKDIHIVEEEKTFEKARKTQQRKV